MTIESKHYVATQADIEKLAGVIIDSDQKVTSCRGTYLKALVATTQHELGAPPRQRNGKSERLTEAEVAAHLKAFQTVSDRFYAVVMQVAKATVPDPDKALLRQRTAFARSAASTVRGYIRAGNDIRVLAAHKVTKAALASPVRRRRLTVDSLKNRATKLAAELERIAKNLSAANREIAQETLAPVLARLAAASGATAHATRDPEKAMEEGIALHTKTGFFVPIDLTAAREARRLAA